MEYYLTPASGLNCEVVHVGRQGDASAVEKLDNRLHHEGQYLWRTFETKREHLPFKQFPLPFKSKEYLDLGILGDIEEGFFPFQPCTHGAMLEPFPDSSDVLHFEVNVTNELVEFLQIQDRSPFVRTPFRFRYSKVWTNILPWYRAHLLDGSFIEKSSDLSIEYIQSLQGDGRVTRSNPLPRSTFVLGRFVTITDNIKVLLINANCPVIVLGVCYFATQFLG